MSMAKKAVDNSLNFEAVKMAINQDKDGYVLKLRILPNDIPEDLLRQWVGQRYICALVALDDNEQPKVAVKKQEANRSVTKAVMVCKEEDFWNWLEEATDWRITNEEDCADALRELLGIESRTEIGKDSHVRARFEETLDEFYKDKRRGWR